MKIDSAAISRFSVFILLLFVSGCASSGPSLVLDPVGPPLPVASSSAVQGTLLVYSAFETGVPNPFLPDDIRHHTSYELRSEDDKTLRIVSNQSGSLGEDPAPVYLPPGKFRVVARSNGYGLVTIPVVIAENKVTTVYLEGGAPLAGKGAVNQTDSVCLPDGERVGWKVVQ